MLIKDVGASVQDGGRVGERYLAEVVQRSVGVGGQLHLQQLFRQWFTRLALHLPQLHLFPQLPAPALASVTLSQRLRVVLLRTAGFL